MSPAQLEDQLKDFLQRDVSFRVKAKTLKKGRLILFNVVDFYIIFTIETAFSNKRQTYEIPFPFMAQRKSPDLLLLDYKLEHIYNNNVEMKMILKRQAAECKSKYLDAEVFLEAY